MLEISTFWTPKNAYPIQCLEFTHTTHIWFENWKNWLHGTQTQSNICPKRLFKVKVSLSSASANAYKKFECTAFSRIHYIYIILYFSLKYFVDDKSTHIQQLKRQFVPFCYQKDAIQKLKKVTAGV